MTTELDVLTSLRHASPLTIAQLARFCHASRRDIEAAIETLRLEGQPIVADGKGLRLTQDPAELASYLEARRRRLVTQYRGTRALRRALRRMQERTALTLWRDVA